MKNVRVKSLLIIPCFLNVKAGGSSLKSISECYSLGFDPSNLACSTCEVLRDVFEDKIQQEKVMKECHFCCQKEYDVYVNNNNTNDQSESLLFSRAVLKFEPMALQMFDQVREFVDSFTEKGLAGHHACKLTLKPSSSSGDNAAAMMMMMGKPPSSPQLVFYDQYGSEQKIIDIGGDLWKKDVLWDMLVAYGIIPKE